MVVRFQQIVLAGLGVVLLALLIYARADRRDEAAYTCQIDRYGVVAHLGWAFFYSREDIVRALELMNGAGINWVRLNWTWKDMQPEPGPFNYERFDTVASLAAEYEINLLPILFSVPPWSSTAPEALKAERGNLSPVDRYRPAERADWLTYVRNVVERYDGDGVDDTPGSPRISHWEVWNEPNLRDFWPPEVDAGEYLDLLADTYETVRMADPTATVVLGGLSGPGVDSDGSGFLPDLYAAGASAYFDIVSIHLYVHPTRGVEPLQEAVARTRAVMDANGDTGKPLWLTETGWSDAPDAWNQPTAAQGEIGGFLTGIFTTPIEADAVFWYNFRNIFDGLDDVEHNFGLVYNDFTPKPSFEAYRAATQACRTPAEK